MENSHCLNCGTTLTANYCAQCGQKADTHRITFSNFFFHDVLHGTFHIERGILFTAKQALIRPGKAALDYIAGKRRPYYNVFLLILLLLGAILFVRHIHADLVERLNEMANVQYEELNEVSRKLDNILSQKVKVVVFLFVPFAALNSYGLFRRKALNLSEHCIIAGMVLLGCLLISFIANAIYLLDFVMDFSEPYGDAASIVTVIAHLAYLVYAYWNAFAAEYTAWGMIGRILLFLSLICVEAIGLFILTFGFISDWKFGEVTLKLFG